MTSDGPPAHRRADEMAALYEAGASLRDVGRAFNVSGEYVRQVIRDAGVQPRSAAETYAVKRDRRLGEARIAVCQMFRETGDVEEVADRLGVPSVLVGQIVRANFSESERRRPNQATKRYSDRELMDFLKEVSEQLGGILTTVTYNKVASTRRTEDGRPWPTHQTFFLRFGSWVKALQAAGLAANPSSPIAGRNLFEKEHCFDAIRALARQLDKTPTAEEYEVFARGLGGAVPSLATVRNRCGQWHGALTGAGL